jgi:hypothetical protein
MTTFENIALVQIEKDNNDNTNSKEKKQHANLMQKFNFFQTKKNGKNPVPKKQVIGNLILTFILCQFLLTANNMIRVNDFATMKIASTQAIFDNYSQIKENLEKGQDTDFLINYNQILKSSTGLGNLLASSMVLMALSNTHLQEQTKEKVVSMWNQNKYTGINREYQMQKNMFSCLPIDISCYFFRHELNFDQMDANIREKITEHDYDIKHFNEYARANKDPLIFYTTDYYQIRTQYAQETNLDSRPKNKDSE